MSYGQLLMDFDGNGGIPGPSCTPPFPPTITAEEIAQMALQKVRQGINSKPSNPFITYRKVMHEHLKSIQHVISMPRLSSMAKRAWQNEDKHVTDYYKELSKKARDIFKHEVAQLNLSPAANPPTNVAEPVPEDDGSNGGSRSDEDPMEDEFLHPPSITVPADSPQAEQSPIQSDVIQTPNPAVDMYYADPNTALMYVFDKLDQMERIQRTQHRMLSEEMKYIRIQQQSILARIGNDISDSTLRSFSSSSNEGGPSTSL